MRTTHADASAPTAAAPDAPGSGVRIPLLGVHFVPAARLTERQRDAMFAIREANMQRVGGGGAAADRARFEASLAGRVAVLVLDRDGELGSFYLASEHAFEGPEGPSTVLCGDYLQAKPAFRGRAGLYVSGALFGLRHLPAAIRGRLYMGGPYLPASYIFTQRVTRMWSLQDPDCPAQAAAMVRALGALLGGTGFDPARGTVPGTARPARRRPRSDAAARLFDRYESYNPDWLQGTELVCVGRITPGVLVRAVRIGLQRALGRPRAAPAVPR